MWGLCGGGHTHKSADVNDPAPGNGALIAAIIGGREKILQVLIDAGVELNAPNRCTTSSPLRVAAICCRLEFVEIWIGRGADLTGKDADITVRKALADRDWKLAKIMRDRGYVYAQGKDFRSKELLLPPPHELDQLCEELARKHECGLIENLDQSQRTA